MTSKVDVVVGGGSVAGLTFAAEAAGRGLSVLVAEEHEQIGEPEKCDGLVSIRGLRRDGHTPMPEVVQNDISSGVIHSPRGRHFAVNISGLEVVVLDRSSFDKQIAEEAVAGGARLVTGARVSRVRQELGGVTLDAGGEKVFAKYYVDATGPSPSHRKGIIPAAKYEIEADWIRTHAVEVFVDAEKYPGFFAWVIPYGRHLAKVGVAGSGISPFKGLDSFLADRHHRVLRRVSAPIYVGGPAARFVEGRQILVGESAGQVKPTTAGGIMTSIAGAVMAARWVSQSVKEGDPRLLDNYQSDWEALFMHEIKTMLRLRGVFSKLSNADLDALIGTIATPKVVLKLSRSDFDFHASALLGVLGLQGLLRLARVVASSEVRSLLRDSS